ncbi:RagB/SusD family nutrient uptake outer membrane protein [uncultured Aquimarina sp.]|uniref:RagB/SusD family nutrient uptake outer membrane protein n=1 Tax=uncultured Aquimarina sp. TaxID=575652 RepID=UPI002604B211|nr:RagB/SusD family nutrient uptake outer membrane protein [uncultured Aquimarina sp.]
MKKDKRTNHYTRFFIATLLMISIGMTNSCADLDPDLTEFNVPPESFANLSELETSVFGLYGLVRTAAVFTTFYSPSWAGDDITTHSGLNKGDFREFDQRNVSATNARLLNNWRGMYNIINNTNIILSRVDALQGFDTVDQDELSRLLGEVYFLRGMAYYHLARTHEKLPLALSRLPEANVSASSRLEVFMQIEEDLLEAESRLPMINAALASAGISGATRVNKGSARALLARFYLDWAGFPLNDSSKYVLAAEMAKKVIDDSSAHGFDLVENFQDLWKLENRFNTESLFTIAYNSSARIRNLKFNRVGYPGEAPFRGWDETYGEIKFFEDFPEGARKEATYRMDIDWKNLTLQKSPILAKITGPAGDLPMTGAWHFTERNDFYMRYAEILLTYAEASGRSGNITTDSWEALNMVRRRAAGLPFNTPVTSPVPQLDLEGNEIPGLTYVDITTGDLAELAFTERKWEFTGEYLRWNDLVRMQRVEQALSNRTPSTSTTSDGTLLQEVNTISGSLSTDNYFSPLPQVIVDENPNLLN